MALEEPMLRRKVITDQSADSDSATMKLREECYEKLLTLCRTIGK